MQKKMNEEPLYLDANIRVVYGITLMAVLGVSSISPALPQISRVFEIGPEQVGLLITVFTLPGIFLTFGLGILADRFGRKRILVPSLLLFGFAGTACAFVGSFVMLMILRFIQGVGAAAIGSLTITLLGDLYSGERQKKAMLYNAGVLSIGTASYPSIGGALASLDWHFPFLLAFFAIPIAGLVTFKLETIEPEGAPDFGGYLRTAWKGIKNVEVIVMLFVSVMTFILLYGAHQTYVPILLDKEYGSSSLIIGIVMSSVSVATGLTSWFLAKYGHSYDGVRLLQTAFLVYCLVMFVIPLVNSLWLMLIPLTLFGAAQGMNIPTRQNLLAEVSSEEYRAAVMSLNGMALRGGQTLGPTIMGMAFLIGGLDLPFLLGAVFALFTFLVLTVTLRK